MSARLGYSDASPLDSFARYRSSTVSVASIGSVGSGILDAFPINAEAIDQIARVAEVGNPSVHNEPESPKPPCQNEPTPPGLQTPRARPRRLDGPLPQLPFENLGGSTYDDDACTIHGSPERKPRLSQGNKDIITPRTRAISPKHKGNSSPPGAKPGRQPPQPDFRNQLRDTPHKHPHAQHGFPGHIGTLHNLHKHPHAQHGTPSHAGPLHKYPIPYSQNQPQHLPGVPHKNAHTYQNRPQNHLHNHATKSVPLPKSPCPNSSRQGNSKVLQRSAIYPGRADIDEFDFSTAGRARHGPSRSWDIRATPNEFYGYSGGTLSQGDLIGRKKQLPREGLERQPPQKFNPRSVRDHIEMGIYQIEAGDPSWALHHWRYSANNGHRLGTLLYAVALREGWGAESFNDDDRYALGNLRQRIRECPPVDQETLSIITGPPCPRLAEALEKLALSYGDIERRSAARACELADVLREGQQFPNLYVK